MIEVKEPYQMAKLPKAIMKVEAGYYSGQCMQLIGRGCEHSVAWVVFCS